jgi:hypothetical protein
LMKKTRVKKSRDTVPLRLIFKPHSDSKWPIRLFHSARHTGGTMSLYVKLT